MKKRPRFEVYKRSDGKWEWRLKAANGRIVATSHGQGYGSRADVNRAVTAVWLATECPLHVREVKA